MCTADLKFCFALCNSESVCSEEPWTGRRRKSRAIENSIRARSSEHSGGSQARSGTSGNAILSLSLSATLDRLCAALQARSSSRSRSAERWLFENQRMSWRIRQRLQTGVFCVQPHRAANAVFPHARRAHKWIAI